MNRRLPFRRVFAYEVERDTTIDTLVRGQLARIDANDDEPPWVELLPSGRLRVREGYTWDGASGPAINTLGVMEASLAHDVLYELVSRRLLPWSTRKAADLTLRALCLAAGVPRWRATYIYLAVRLFGGFWLDPVRALFPRTR